MAYSFYLDNVILPVTPSKFSVSIQNKNKTIELINDKQVNILKLPGLTDISFEFVLPNSKYPFATNWQPPQYYLSVLEKLKINLQPFQFVIARNLPDGKPSFATNMSVSLESYEIVEDAENGLDITVKINLKQYRPYATQTVEIKTASDGSTVSVEKMHGRKPNNLIKLIPFKKAIHFGILLKNILAMVLNINNWQR